MRPVKLTISAFGAYAGINEIDFDKLGTGGIYLITGDTGAGKTTAVSYTHLPKDCPLCKENIPYEKPGSRNIK